MALASTSKNRYVTVTATGQSDHISLPPNANGGKWVLAFRSAGAFALDLQRAADGSNFADMYDINNNKITVNTATPTYQDVEVSASQYRMDVDTYNNPITMTATEA